MTDFYVAKVHNGYAVFSRKTGAADTVFDTHAEAKINCDEMNYDLQVKSTAHELLAVLKAIESWWIETGRQKIGKGGTPSAMFTASAAITKAEGRS